MANYKNSSTNPESSFANIQDLQNAYGGMKWDDLQKLFDAQNAASYGQGEAAWGGDPGVNAWYDIPGIGRAQAVSGQNTSTYGGDNGSAYAGPDSFNYMNKDNGKTYLSLERGNDGGVTAVERDQNHSNKDLNTMLAIMATMGAGSAALGPASASGAAAPGFSALPAGGMTATGSLGAAPWAATAGEGLGSGLVGTGVGDIGALMGTQGGAFELGSGLSGVTSADLAGSSFVPEGDYSNEGRNYPTSESTANSPINSPAPNLDLSGAKFPTDLLQNIAKKLLTPGGSGSGAGGASSGGGQGGFGGVFNAPANETPGMLAAQAAPQQQQAIAQALLLGNPSQPQFNPGGYMQVPQGVTPNSQMMQLAQAFQQDA